MSEEKSGLLINLFDKDIIYSVSEKNEETVSSENIKTEQPPIENTSSPEGLVGIGNNNKGILIIYDNASSDTLDNNSTQVLNKIFGALNLDLQNDTLLVNKAKNNGFKREQIEALDAKLLITFGINLFQVGYTEVELLNYEMKTVGNLLVLPSEEIHKMTTKVEAKKAFWLAIQRAVSNL